LAKVTQQLVVFADDLAEIAAIVRMGDQFLNDDIVNGRHSVL